MSSAKKIELFDYAGDLVAVPEDALAGPTIFIFKKTDHSCVFWTLADAKTLVQTIVTTNDLHTQTEDLAIISRYIQGLGAIYKDVALLTQMRDDVITLFTRFSITPTDLANLRHSWSIAVPTFIPESIIIPSFAVAEWICDVADLAIIDASSNTILQNTSCSAEKSQELLVARKQGTATFPYLYLNTSAQIVCPATEANGATSSSTDTKKNKASKKGPGEVVEATSSGFGVFKAFVGAVIIGGIIKVVSVFKKDTTIPTFLDTQKHSSDAASATVSGGVSSPRKPITPVAHSPLTPLKSSMKGIPPRPTPRQPTPVHVCPSPANLQPPTTGTPHRQTPGSKHPATPKLTSFRHPSPPHIPPPLTPSTPLTPARPLVFKQTPISKRSVTPPPPPGTPYALGVDAPRAPERTPNSGRLRRKSKTVRARTSDTQTRLKNRPTREEEDLYLSDSDEEACSSDITSPSNRAMLALQFLDEGDVQSDLDTAFSSDTTSPSNPAVKALNADDADSALSENDADSAPQRKRFEDPLPKGSRSGTPPRQRRRYRRATHKKPLTPTVEAAAAQEEDTLEPCYCIFKDGENQEFYFYWHTYGALVTYAKKHKKVEILKTLAAFNRDMYQIATSIDPLPEWTMEIIVAYFREIGETPKKCSKRFIYQNVLEEIPGLVTENPLEVDEVASVRP